MAAAAARPRLLLCFDAFGTLFRPRASVAHQYGDVARQHGLTDFSDADLEASLVAAVKDERKLHPNYGKATDLGATAWWNNVIRKTFEPLLSHGQALPPGLSPALLHRFSSKDGYETERPTVTALRSLRTTNRDSLELSRFETVVVGVITNSDDRVPDILSSLGLDVSPMRYGATEAHPGTLAGPRSHDVDFHCMSYDVGVEKPDRRIFQAAEDMLAQIIETREGKDPTESRADLDTWEKLYVGDEYEKDVVGAQNAGWKVALLVPKSDDGGKHEHAAAPRLEDHVDTSFHDVFRQHPYATVQSIHNLVEWVRTKK